MKRNLRKLDKYFSNEITGNIMVIKEKAGYKVEATINAKGNDFQSRECGPTTRYDAVDRVIDKLSSQMSRFKAKLQKKVQGTAGTHCLRNFRNMKRKNRK